MSEETRTPGLHDERATRSWSVRPATVADLDRLVEFNLAMARETEEKELDKDRLVTGVLGVFENPSRGSYWVCESEGWVSASLLVTYEWSDWRNGDFWWIQSVYVEPASRRRGAYSALYRHLLDKARETRGVCGLRLYVDQDNASARATYERLGMGAARYDMFEVDFVFK